MPKSFLFRRGGATGEVGINMTPMIDCTFQLIIFFILASQVASQSLAKLDLHRPEQSQAIPTKEIETPRKVIVNILSEEGEKDFNPALAGAANRYEIDGNPIGIWETEKLLNILKTRKFAAGDEEFHIEIRADNRVSFGDVRPVMRAAAEAEIINMSITALTEVSD